MVGKDSSISADPTKDPGSWVMNYASDHLMSVVRDIGCRCTRLSPLRRVIVCGIHTQRNKDLLLSKFAQTLPGNALYNQLKRSHGDIRVHILLPHWVVQSCIEHPCHEGLTSDFVIVIEGVVRSEASIMKQQIPDGDLVLPVVVSFWDPLHPRVVKIEQPHIVESHGGRCGSDYL